VVKPPWLLETNQWQKFSYIDLPTEIPTEPGTLRHQSSYQT